MGQSKIEEQERYLKRRCVTDDELWTWLRFFLGLEVPRRSVCPDHNAPFEYVRRAYFEPSSDAVVWAPRGGGKTRLGAAISLMELLHKPGIELRVLGGSLEQSLRMWRQLQEDVELVLPQAVKPGAPWRRLELLNGSKAAVLAQSEKAVRGLRVQKLRCDEVEMFDKEIWEAAQMVTKSKMIDGKMVKGTIEALSTYHKPWGLMKEVIDTGPKRGVEVIKWCILDVLEKCPADRPCEGCLLWDECQGRAKDAEGFFSIDDAITLKQRSSVEKWETEMLCRRPSATGAVFRTFERGVHARGEGLGARASGLAPDQTRDPRPETLGSEMTLALDFGFANPFVCLWVASDAEGNVRVVDEYVQPGRTVEEHLEHIEARGWGKVRRVACDPAGGARNEQTADSNIRLLRRRGYRVFHRRSLIVEGIELIRAALKTAGGKVSLTIEPKCERLIKALESYHYAVGGSELPVKDGEHDHLVDALRYFFVNRVRGKVEARGY